MFKLVFKLVFKLAFKHQLDASLLHVPRDTSSCEHLSEHLKGAMLTARQPTHRQWRPATGNLRRPQVRALAFLVGVFDVCCFECIRQEEEGWEAPEQEEESDVIKTRQGVSDSEEEDEVVEEERWLA